MLQGLLLLILVSLLVVASYTDFKWRKIYNWTTYPGILAGLMLRTFAGGYSAFEDSFKGFLVCGIIMIVCYILFGLGGGDVKLIAMMGAFLGFERGVEALLWTLILGGIMGTSVIVWQIGFVNIVRGVGRHLHRMWKLKAVIPPDEKSRIPLQQTLFLAPAGMMATLIVTWPMWSDLFQFVEM